MKKSFKQFTSQIEVLSESQEGMLRGGFKSISLNELALPGNNGKGCTCNKDCPPTVE